MSSLIIYLRCKNIERKKVKNTWKNIQKKAGSQSGDATSQFQFIYEILTVYFEQLLRNLSQKITVLDA